VIAPHRAPVEVSRSAEPEQLDPGSLFMQSRDLTLRPLYLVCGRRIDRAGATDRLRPWSKKTARSCRVVAPSFGKESPNSCQGLPQRNGERARIRKDGPQDQGGATYGP
jgi:hypothetical protein